MQQNVILRTFLIVVLTLISVFVAITIFSAEGNVLGNSFRFLTPLAVVIGLGAPRFAFYLLLFAGAYLDLIKRFMILDSRFSDLDLAFLLGFAPAIVTGLVLKFLVLVISKAPNVTARETKLFIITTGLCAFMGIAQATMGGGLRSAGGAFNMVAYLYMPLLIPRIFKDIAELKKLMIATVIIYLPAALWAIHQAYYGLEAFEMQYLQSGMTTEIRQLDEQVFRNMGTMVSAHALSMVASILAVSLLIPVSWKTGKLSPKVWLNPIRWVFIWLFVSGAYFTFSRTGWVCATIAVIAFVFLQSRLLTFAAFFTTLIGIVALYASADLLLKNRVMQDGQDILFNKFGATAEARQSLVLGTLDARLESMASFATDASIWTPFGLKAAGSDVQLKWVHDILTETLIKVGYVPLSILVFGTITGAFMALRGLFQMPKGPHRMMTSYFAALALGMISGGFSQGAMILFFPINFFWCLFLALTYSLSFWQKQLSAEALEQTSTSPLDILTPIGRSSRRHAGSRQAVI
jgi:hypothetical protein